MNLVATYKDTVAHCPDSNSVTEKHFYKVSDRKMSAKPNILVEALDSVSALIKYSSESKTCVLNMASHVHPGGGVENGAKSQEECLFRCSNLFETMDKKFYPLEDDCCLYTTNALFFKDVYYNYIWAVTVDVISIAAFDLNLSHGRRSKIADYERMTKNKIRLMCSLPAQHEAKNLILGAWGCGAFKNDPEKIANYFKEILIEEGYSSLYDNVIFAVINDSLSVGNNYLVFKNAFENT